MYCTYYSSCNMHAFISYVTEELCKTGILTCYNSWDNALQCTLTSSLTQLRGLSELAHETAKLESIVVEAQCAAADSARPRDAPAHVQSSRIADTQKFAQFVPRLRASRTRGYTLHFSRVLWLWKIKLVMYTSRARLKCNQANLWRLWSNYFVSIEFY